MSPRVRTKTASEVETKQALVRGAWRTLRERGFRSATSRAIAAEGGVNQALVFYHFGGVNNLLLAALDWSSSQRMQQYRQAAAQADTFEELVRKAAAIAREDLEEGHMGVAAEMIAGSFADPTLRPAVRERTEDWLRFTSDVIRPLLERSLLTEVVSADDVAFAIVAFAAGMNLLSRLEEDTHRVNRLFDAAETLQPLLSLLFLGPESS